MPFDREGAKAAGYTDAEIDTYLAQQAPAPSTQESPGGIADNPLFPWALGIGAPLAIGAGAYGAAKLAKQSPRLVKAAAKLIVPGYGKAAHAQELFQELRGGAASAAPAPSAAPAEATQVQPLQPRPTRGLHVLTEHDVANVPVYRRFQPGTPVNRDRYERIMMGEEGAQPAGPRGVVEGGKKGAAVAEELPPATRARLQVVTPEPVAAQPPTPGVSRHEVQYYSEGRGKFVPIEDMSISHLRNAMNKLQAKLTKGKGRPSPVTQKQFEAIKNEVTFRAQQAGELTVPGPVGKAQTAAAEAFEQQALRRALGGAGQRALGTGLMGLPFLLQLLQGQSLEQQMQESAPILERLQRPEERELREFLMRYQQQI